MKFVMETHKYFQQELKYHYNLVELTTNYQFNLQVISQLSLKLIHNRLPLILIEVILIVILQQLLVAYLPK